MTNFDTAREALETSINSEGSALEEHAKYMNSIEAKLSQLKASWQSFAQTFMDSDTLKGGIDALKGLVDILEWLIDNFGLLGTLGLGVAGKSIFGYFKGAKEAKKTLNDVVDAVNNIPQAMANAANATTETAEAMTNTASAATETSESMTNVVSTTTEVAETSANAASGITETTESMANMGGVATETAESVSNISSATTEAAESMTNLGSAVTETAETMANVTSTATETAEAVTNVASASTEAAEAATNLASGGSEIVETVGNIASTATDGAEAVGNIAVTVTEAGETAVKSAGGFKAFATSTAGIVTGVGLAIAAIALIINAYKNYKEELSAARQETIETSNEFLDAASSFEQAYIKYSGRTDLTADEEADLESAIQGTVDALDDKSSALQGVVNSSNDYLASLERIKDAELDAANTAAKKKKDNAELELKDIAGLSASSLLVGEQTKIAVEIPHETDEAGKIAQEVASEYWDDVRIGGTYKAYQLDVGKDADIDKIIDYYYTLLEYQERLSEAELIDTTEYDNVTVAIDKMSEAIATYESGVYEAAKAQYQLSNGIPKTVDEYLKMRESILKSNDVKGLSVDTKKMIAGSLDSEYKSVFDLSTANVQARQFIGVLDNFTEDHAKDFELFLNMKTAVNNGECTVGDYMSQLSDIKGVVGKFSEEDQEEINLAFGIDTDAIKQQYDDVYKYISRNYIEKLNTTGMSSFDAREYKNHEVEKIQNLLDGLSATELQAVASIKAEIDWKNTNTDKILAQIKKEAEFIEAMNFTIAIDVETESVEALNTAMAESVSGAGLSSEAIAALKGRYAELAEQGYDLSAMFEETSNGIHLNRDAVSEFEQALASQKLSETDGKLDVLKDRYDELTKEIENCTDAGERAHLYSEQQEVAQKINDLATLATQYRGLTSAYNAWQNAESAGQERDMYESIIEGFENIGDEISRGWYDDGTIKFLELMTGQTDLAGKSASELKEIWKGLDDTIKGTSYSVRDFFTTDDEGNSTSTGAYNFLRAVEELGKNGGLKALEGKNIEDLIVRNDKGKIVEFDFDVVGGDKAVAEALGISEELVQIIQRTLDDAGFVVTLDGKYTLLADLKTSAEEANNTLKKLKSEGLESLKDVDLNFDFNVDTVEGYQEQLEKATAVLDKFRDKNGKLKTDKNGNLVEGAKQALEIAEYYTAAMDKLTEPKFMQIDTSTVDEELQEPIEKIQEIGDLCKEKHLVALTGDTKELNKVQGEIDKVAKEIEELDPEVKAQIGIDENWDAKTIADKIEKGEIEIPAELKLDVQMSEDLKDIRLLMMRQLGLVSEEEVKLKVGYDIDESTVDDLTPDKQKVAVEFIAENEEWFNKLTDDKKKIVIDLVTNGIDLSIFDDEEKKVVIEYIEKDIEWFDKLDDEEKKVVVKYVAEHGEIDKWTPEAKDAFVKYLVDGGDPDKFDPDDKESWVVYKKDSSIPDGYIPNNPDAIVKYKKDSSIPDNYDPDDPDATVKYGKDSLIPDSYIPLDPPATVIFDKDTSAIDTYDPPNFVRTVTYKIKEGLSTAAAKGEKILQKRFGTGSANGTANVDGTTGRAFQQGSWGTKNSGTALVGELGRETLVRDGKYYTIGDNGAEFIRYQRGDIIFNHKQTEELFNNGRVTSDGGRAKALVSGTALLKGTAFGSGTGGGEEPDTIVVGTNSNTGKSYTKSKDNKDFEETFDWIETAISRVERAIDNLDQTANATYKSWSSRNKALTQEISKVGSEITLQEKAYKEYMAAANAVGLSYSWKKKVQNGTVDISTVKDEALADKISDYQKWYELALKSKDAIEDLKDTEAELYAQRFENVQTQYDGILQGYEHTESMLNEYISQTENQGHIVSKKYYQALINNEKGNISQLKKEQAALITERDKAVADGKITKYSEEWYNMCQEIDGVTQAIEEGTTKLIEYDNAMRQIDWDTFDMKQEHISDVTAESDFMIDLMSNKDLHDDKGNLTAQGAATLGLHGLNHNTYMYQADDYGKEIAKLDKQIAKDPYDQELINRRRELVKLQQESILAAEDEKQAIKDLVQDGIDKELDSLQELIDKKNKALESEKDLYEYQKKVKEQTEEIASLEKQMAAYSGDDSEESKAKIQELKVSLEDAKENLKETEWDKYISDTSALLDTLYTEYETILNTRLDNIDDLLAQVVAGINAGMGGEGAIATALGSDGAIAAAIANAVSENGGMQTILNKEATAVGTTLSTAMNNIWSVGDGNAKSILTTYGTGFQDKQTTTNTTLSGIKASVDKMASESDKEAEKKVKSNKTSTSAKKDPTKDTNTKKKNTTTKKKTTNNKSSGDGKAKVGDKVKFVSGQYYYDSQGKKPLGSKYKGKQVYITSINNKSWATHPYHISTGKKLGSGDLGWLKLNQLSGYAVGKKKISNSQYAWTQENGQEYIVRPSDGAILTPVAKGDSVLNAAASGNIWSMANNPAEFIKNNLGLDNANIPNGTTVQNTYSQHIDNVVFRMDNVKNYEEMLSAMQKDKNFERLILSMSIDRLAGKSALAKGKSIR